MKLVLATQNPKKLKEMNEILSHLGVEVVSEAELGVRIEVEETGETFTDNARLKATAVMQATGLPAVADDSGLCVDALNGGPGVYSARFGGEGLDDKGRYTLLLEMLRGQTDRAAHFHTSIVCAFPNGDELVCEGECPGTIAFAPMGEGGFGYDPVFFVPELRKTFGQLTAEEKASVSHRGKALRAFAAALDDYLSWSPSSTSARTASARILSSRRTTRLRRASSSSAACSITVCSPRARPATSSAASPAPSRCRSSARNSCSIARRTPSPRKSASRS